MQRKLRDYEEAIAKEAEGPHYTNDKRVVVSVLSRSIGMKLNFVISDMNLYV